MCKQVLITGSSRGIGKETALYLAKNGYNIILHCNKNIQKAQEVLKEAELSNVWGGGRILQFDITNRDECRKILSEDIKSNGVYYGVVLNAGINRDAVFPALKDDDWDSVINTNLGGFYNVLKPIVMPMITNRIKGRIVTMSSVSGLRGNYGQVNYSASKAGIIGASKALALELAKRGITVNCIAPGIIDSDMTKDLSLDMVKKLIPMKRTGNAKEVASLVNYLLSEDAGYITGQVISVNGGLY